MIKNVQSVVVAVLLVAILSSSVSAEAGDTFYSYSDGNVCIVIDMTNINEDQANKIIRSFTNDLSNSYSTMSLMCTLFGHSISTTKTSITTHNCYSSAPHCKVDIYDTEVCERCEYTMSTWKSSYRTNCH